MNFIFGLICMAIIVYLFLYFRPREKDALIVMALGCIMALLQMTVQTHTSVLGGLFLAGLQVVMVLCCASAFKEEYERRKKRKKAMRSSVHQVSEKSDRVTA